MREDVAYINQFLSGDEKAFDALVRKYQDRVLNITYSLIGRDRESEDIAQEVFLKVYHGLNSFRNQSQFSTWLYRIVVNTVYDFLRKRKKFLSDQELLEASVFTGEGPRESLMNKENDAFIQKAIDSIPVHYRVALVLKDIENLSYAEISSVLKCSIGTVESRIFRARQFLKEELIRTGKI